MRLFAFALAMSLLALVAAFPGDLRSETSLSVKASLSADDPRSKILEGWIAELASQTGWSAEVELLGPGAVAGARTAMADPDGLTLGFLSLDETITRPLQDLAPYRASDFLPAVLFPGDPPVLVRRPGGPDVEISRRRPGQDRAARLLAPSLNPVPGPTLAAVAALRSLGYVPSVRELPADYAAGAPAGASGSEAPAGASGREAPWAAAFAALEPGELLALPREALDLLPPLGLSPAQVMTLSPPAAGVGTPAHLALPGGTAPADPGAAPGVRELFGFYYPSATGPRLQEGAPARLAAMASAAFASPQDFPFVTGPPMTADEAREAFDAETAARRSILESLNLAGGAQ
ncbi:MAG: hypothetical protein LBT40_18305 [Deltaproteobacteria bacterium]|jgi:hypothetical protein|nr:hypothetical protein [Deltaproteobacteria bacterium]